MAEHLLDTKGLNCPMPVIQAKKAMKAVPRGGMLKVLTTDPGSVTDFQAFCRATGHELVERDVADGVYSYLIKSTG